MSDVAQCPLCQKYIDVTLTPEVCPKCGGNLVGAKFTSDDRGPYYGVGGWLLLFCVSLTILGPLLSIFSILQEINESNRISAMFPQIETAVKIEAAFTVFLVTFSLWAGISLWTIRPRAVQIAKIYLLVLPIASIIMIFLVANVLPPMASEIIVKESTVPIIRTIIYSIVWFLYLSSSQRVAATYQS